MDAKNDYDVRPVETAEAFLAALAPDHDDWSRREWIFRGQGDAEWSLVPTVLRHVVGKRPRWHWQAFVDSVGDFDTRQLPHVQRRLGEAKLVLSFRHLADRVGLAIPEDSARLRSWRHLDAIIGARFGSRAPPSFMGMMEVHPKRRWPQSELVSVVALAQHYGVPTRLLDWTWKARVAAYFAARDVMRHGHTGSIAVWALQPAAIDDLWSDQVEDPEVEVIQAPQAANPNLAAQAGVFTVARHVHENHGLETVLLDRANEKGRPLKMALRKYTLPTSEAKALMARLACEDVTAATVFPGYAGVAEAIVEGDWWSGA